VCTRVRLYVGRSWPLVARVRQVKAVKTSEVRKQMLVYAKPNGLGEGEAEDYLSCFRHKPEVNVRKRDWA